MQAPYWSGQSGKIFHATPCRGFLAARDLKADIWQNRPSLVMTSDMGMATTSDPGGMRDAATNPLPEWGRRERVRGAAGRHPPLEDIH